MNAIIAKTLLALGMIGFVLPLPVVAQDPSPSTKKKVYPLVVQETGVRITRVLWDSPARRAGLVNGDIIVKVGNTRVSDLRDLENALREVRGWTRLTVVKEYTGRRTLVWVNPNRYGRIGIYGEVASISPERDRAVRITYVWPGSPARRAGLEANDIILRVDGREIDTLTDLSNTLRWAGSNARLTVINHRNGRTTSLYVYPDSSGRIGISAEETFVSTSSGSGYPY